MVRFFPGFILPVLSLSALSFRMIPVSIVLCRFDLTLSVYSRFPYFEDIRQFMSYL